MKMSFLCRLSVIVFDMSNDSHLFHDAPDLDDNDNVYLPLYEAKMIHQFDPRWAGYRKRGNGTLVCSDISDDTKKDPDATAPPRYWVHELDALKRPAAALGIQFDPQEDRKKLTAFLDKQCPR
jgi:hypothetical protein